LGQQRKHVFKIAALAFIFQTVYSRMIASQAVVAFASQQLGLQHPAPDGQTSNLRTVYDYSKCDFEESVLLDGSVSCSS
jgi:hypothetical protein